MTNVHCLGCTYVRKTAFLLGLGADDHLKSRHRQAEKSLTRQCHNFRAKIEECPKAVGSLVYHSDVMTVTDSIIDESDTDKTFSEAQNDLTIDDKNELSVVQLDRIHKKAIAMCLMMEEHIICAVLIF